MKLLQSVVLASMFLFSLSVAGSARTIWEDIRDSAPLQPIFETLRDSAP
jgi:hypothetical protein